MKQPTRNYAKGNLNETYNLLYSMFHSAYMELRDLTKKAPQETLSSLKIKTLNRILERIRNFLSNEPAIDFLDIIEEDSLPSASDTLLLMSQYAGAIENYYKKHYEGISDKKFPPNFSK
jgi:hypothetical protein